jgi:hypothetical protein
MEPALALLETLTLRMNVLGFLNLRRLNSRAVINGRRISGDTRRDLLLRRATP